MLGLRRGSVVAEFIIDAIADAVELWLDLWTDKVIHKWSTNYREKKSKEKENTGIGKVQE